MFIEFTDAASRTTSGGIKIGIHGIKLGKFRIDLPGWAGVFSDLVKAGHAPGDAALAATSEQVKANPAALQAALFGQGRDPNKFWDLLTAIFGENPQALQNADAANTAVMQAEDGSKTSAGPLLLIGAVMALMFLGGGFKRFTGGGRSGGRRTRSFRRSRYGRKKRSFQRKFGPRTQSFFRSRFSRRPRRSRIKSFRRRR